MHQNIAKITVIGDDKKGVIAQITNFVFEHGSNIEDIDQKVIRHLFQMIMKIDISELKVSKDEFREGLKKLEKKLNMEIKVEFYSEKSKPNLLLMMTKEKHCPEAILEKWAKNEFEVNIPLIIGSSKELKYLADHYGIPFYVFDNPVRKNNEIAMLEFLKNFDIDLIVLARYMRILSPDFVWRYENKIINIHPSLLPAFPGAEAYRQAFEKGVKIAGVTAHFVTMDLDQGPIIAQEAFQIESTMTLDQIKQKGQEAEVKALLKAVDLFLKERLLVYWNKVHFQEE
ncbi:MAG: formyltetrahydrofolate deformylase [Spirochaetes bacterium GWB1_36_13]|nr:MAG: formyltetrahydrofolate deformylase [Spirochaetes bacterium GWB1_36_13]